MESTLILFHLVTMILCLFNFSNLCKNGLTTLTSTDFGKNQVRKFYLEGDYLFFNKEREWYFTCMYMYNQHIAKNFNLNIAHNFLKVRGMLQ